MSRDFDKQEWQAEQAARDVLLDKEREKHRKARERSARNAQRKLERLRRSLGESGELSDWEDEFSESVTERLDKYGAAFADRQKGRPGDALSFAQKRVVAALNKKAKDQRKALRAKARGEGAGDSADKKSGQKFSQKRSSFSSKKKPKYKPRVRQLDEGFEDADIMDNEIDTAPPIKSGGEDEPYLPKYELPTAPPRPFLRLVSSKPRPVHDRRKLG